MTKIGRNDPCPCGSGKKYKKCCINKPLVTSTDGTVSVMDDRTIRAKENLEKGYQSFYEGNEREAVQFWQLLWEGYVKDELGNTDLEGFDEVIQGSELMVNWFQEWPVALQNVAREDLHCANLLLEYSNAMLEEAEGYLPDLEESMGLFKAVALSRIGRNEDASAEFERLCETFPTYCSIYEEWSFHLRDKDSKKALTVLELGLKNCTDPKDHEVLTDHIELLKEHHEN